MGNVRSLRDRIVRLEQHTRVGAPTITAEPYTTDEGVRWVRYRYVNTGAFLDVPANMDPATWTDWAATFRADHQE